MATTNAISSVTQKGQATIPAPVRSFLNIHPGDRVVFSVEANEVKVRKAQGLDKEYYQALGNTLSEWESEADNKAYNDL